jgi:GNAT superfamily N-acetyltransferase
MRGVDRDVEELAVIIRPMAVDDLDALRRFFFRLSPETVYRRFFRPVRDPSPATLRYFAEVDHELREALVAEVDGELVGVARYDRSAQCDSDAEVAIVVEDAWQHRGLGQRLMRRLSAVAYDSGVRVFTADVLGGNREAMHLVRTLSPSATVQIASGDVVVRAPLQQPPTVAA